MRGALVPLIVLWALTTGNPVFSADNPVTVQVLLQGGDAAALRQALAKAGGTETHDLPIVEGVGGWAPADNLDQLATDPAVEQLTQDFNLPVTPERRSCVVAGDLYVTPTAQGLRWRVHNFDDSPQALQWLQVGWPSELGEAKAFFAGDEQLPDGRSATIVLGNQQRTDAALQLATGATELYVAFEQWPGQLQQNDIDITLGFSNCETKLVRAYADNDSDFYYAAESGATLLHDAGITGAGIGVAIVDTGLWARPELINNRAGKHRIPAHYNAILDTTDGGLEDPGGHGTHMASIIANSRPVSREGGSGFLGVAPDATVIPVTAIRARGDGDFMDIIRGIQWVVAHRHTHNIRVLNLSLTAAPTREYWRDPMNQAVIQAWAEGILVVVAAGNDGPAWGTIGSPGNNPYVLTVGAYTDSWTPGENRDDYIPDFSSRGPTPEGLVKPDLVAPGGHITGLLPPDSELGAENPNYFLPSGHYVATGSSQAAAVVSGLAALLLQAKPELSNDEIKCLLTTSAQPAINRDGRLSYSPLQQGAGRANVARALTLGDTQCSQQSLDIAAAVAGEERLLGPAERDSDGNPSLPGMDQNIARKPSAKGLSSDRRWGVAEHLERLDPTAEHPEAPGLSLDWLGVYQQELRRLDTLQNPSPAE